MLKDGAILIRLARGLSAFEERRHIENLLRRMSRAAVKYRSRTVIDPLRPLLAGASRHSVTSVTGTTMDFDVMIAEKGRTKAVRSPSGWIIHRSPKSDIRTFHRFLWKLVSISAAEEADALVREINAETFGELVRSVKLKFMHSQWGSCSLGRNITLATPLLFTSPEILRYVIIHELAHILHHDHSSRFWNAVESHCHSMRHDRSLLKQMTLPRV